MTLHIPFKNTYVNLPNRLFSRQKPYPVRDPKLLAFNQPLADMLGVTGTDDAQELAQVFSGTSLPKGAAPIAQLYAGHQFGNWNPQLGDGRAVLLGESNGYDIQLKGSGPTPYARRGDGRAWLGPVLREYVVSEAMHALGIPTTRALAAVQTGEEIMRDRPLPGAVLTRVAASHLRVGTFQALAARQDTEGLQTLMEYACARHYPEADTPAAFLKEVVKSQALLVAKWMSVGFIHGVMNTDNCTISGETIDYGPCAFMDAFHPGQVFSSIDRHGRYAYGNQPQIIAWNMAQLATSLLPLENNSDKAVEEFTHIINEMPGILRHHWQDHFAAKLGLSDTSDSDEALITQLLAIMTDLKADFTNSFRHLTDSSVPETELTPHKDYAAWHEKWAARTAQQTIDPQNVMRQANPYIIPRNHQIEAMISQAVSGDFTLFHGLNTALEKPFDTIAEHGDLTTPPTAEEKVTQTFCGT
ncbi:protein adenylyltransferase SelO [uncultured Shimia sp.]|uniref:protein adenylyltransferase SelO n=1 Tax=uncultured Shimia sp. TaxID=573152 RepID=UPI0026028CEF|nr:YdiU family protein [uncultured Shimia sp.]